MTYNALKPAFCAANKIITLGNENKSVTFGMVNTNDTVLKLRIKKAFRGFDCLFTGLTPEVFNMELSKLYSEDQIHTDVLKNENGVTSAQSIIDRIEDDAPIINLLNNIFQEAILKRASDIHIETGNIGAEVLYRIDGILIKAKTISREKTNALSARIKILANLNVLENRQPQDGHIEIKSEKFSLDVRVSIVPAIYGESIVLRLLNRSDIPFSLDSLGFSQKHSVCLKKLLAVTSGLILVTGPTGSGKTTTLAAILRELNDGKTKIISIEDPVEYRIKGITQIQVNEDLKLTFNSLLRRIFRQDPDIIMIGEIRDTETAELAVRAALTGHLVFATLHTNNAVEAVYRLQNLGISGYMIAAVLKMIIAQRLIRKICTGCGGCGCDKCSQTGFYARTVVAEFITIEEEMQKLISAGSTIDRLTEYLRETGHDNFFDDAKEKVKSGITTEQEMIRELGVKE